MRVVFCAAVLCAFGASAAELPSRATKARPAEEKARTCEIGGAQGVLLANGTCFKIGGTIDAGVTSGKRQALTCRAKLSLWAIRVA